MRTTFSGCLRLAAAVAAIAVVWLAVLPWMGEQPHVARHIERQQRLGIDPSAMFYTELEILPSIAHRIERLNLHVMDLKAGHGPASEASSTRPRSSERDRRASRGRPDT